MCTALGHFDFVNCTNLHTIKRQMLFLRFLLPLHNSTSFFLSNIQDLPGLFSVLLCVCFFFGCLHVCVFVCVRFFPFDFLQFICSKLVYNLRQRKIEYNYIIIYTLVWRTHFDFVFAQKPVANKSIKGSSCVNTTLALVLP